MAVLRDHDRGQAESASRESKQRAQAERASREQAESRTSRKFAIDHAFEMPSSGALLLWDRQPRCVRRVWPLPLVRWPALSAICYLFAWCFVCHTAFLVQVIGVDKHRGMICASTPLPCVRYLGCLAGVVQCVSERRDRGTRVGSTRRTHKRSLPTWLAPLTEIENALLACQRGLSTAAHAGAVWGRGSGPVAVVCTSVKRLRRPNSSVVCTAAESRWSESCGKRWWCFVIMTVGKQRASREQAESKQRASREQAKMKEASQICDRCLGSSIHAIVWCAALVRSTAKVCAACLAAAARALASVSAICYLLSVCLVLHMPYGFLGSSDWC